MRRPERWDIGSWIQDWSRPWARSRMGLSELICMRVRWLSWVQADIRNGCDLTSRNQRVALEPAKRTHCSSRSSLSRPFSSSRRLINDSLSFLDLA